MSQPFKCVHYPKAEVMVSAFPKKLVTNIITMELLMDKRMGASHETGVNRYTSTFPGPDIVLLELLMCKKSEYNYWTIP